jgi:hypothetical protein
VPLVLLLVAATAENASPKDAAKALFHAISLGDRAGVRAALYAGDEAQEAYADAMADMIIAGNTLGEAAKRQFGVKGSGFGAGTLDPAGIEKIEQATVKVEGDAATLTVPGQPRPMSFRRDREGRWGLVILDLTSTTQPVPDVAKQTKLVRMLADAMQTSAREIAAGEYKTAEDAVLGVQQRLHNVMLSFHRPTTRRSTTGGTTAATTATAPAGR